MMKRAIVTDEIFRISIPGVDVDAASDHEFVLHEGHLAAQPYHTEWVACPFAGAGYGTYSVEVPIIGPSVILPNTQIMYYSQGATGNSYFPANIAPEPTGVVDAWGSGIRGNMFTMQDLKMTFGKSGASAAPNGAWVIYMRAPEP